MNIVSTLLLPSLPAYRWNSSDHQSALIPFTLNSEVAPYSCLEQTVSNGLQSTMIINTGPFRIELFSKTFKNSLRGLKCRNMECIYGKNTRPFSPLVLLFYFPETKNKTQNSFLKPHMEMLREHLVYGEEKKPHPPCEMFIF